MCAAIKTGKYPFMMCNFAPPDMVGHTGKYEPAVRACEATGQCAHAPAYVRNSSLTSSLFFPGCRCRHRQNPPGVWGTQLRHDDHRWPRQRGEDDLRAGRPAHGPHDLQGYGGAPALLSGDGGWVGCWTWWWWQVFFSPQRAPRSKVGFSTILTIIMKLLWLIEWVSERASEWVRVCVIEWASEWVIEWLSDWVIEWVRACVSEWVSEWVRVCVSECVCEWVRACVRAWVSACAREWVSECVCAWVSELMREWVIEWVGEWVMIVGFPAGWLVILLVGWLIDWSCACLCGL